MLAPAIPPNEDERLEALRRYKVLDTKAEQVFDDLTFLAAEICEAPIALVSLVDESRQWFKSRVGLSATETAREISFCGHAILDGKVLVVPDTHTDERFADNPLVRSDLDVRFYAGAPLLTPDGFAIGTLCVLDHQPRQLTQRQILALEALSRQAIGQMELRLSLCKTEEAREEAVRACRVKSEFLSNMSHEMRTPLNGILGMTNLLADSFGAPSAREKLRIIKDCGESLLDLINDILDYSDLESGKIELKNEALSLQSLIDEVFQSYAGKAAEKRISFSYLPDESVPQLVFADSKRLRQILSNLVSNAIKFSDHGKIEVSTSSRALQDRSIEVIVRVRDDGIGVPETIRNRLFQAFAQGDTSATRQFGGIGLGLAICYKLCEKMEGRIWVDSPPGQGSVFTFSFKTTPAVDTRASTVHSNSFVLNTDFARRNPHRILIAEDNRLNQVVLLGLLEKLGYRADVVENGSEVIHRLAANDYDIILMDCQMPVMDGFETAERIRSAGTRSTQPHIAAVTASVSQDNIDKCRRAGMDGFLGKPVRPEALAQVLTFPGSTPIVDTEPAQEAEGPRIFDQEKLLHNFRGIEDLLATAIEQFCSQAPSVVRKMAESVALQDSMALEMAAHSLRGSVSNFFCERADHLTWSLEQMARGSVGPEAKLMVDELKNVIMNICVELTEFSRKLRSS